SLLAPLLAALPGQVVELRHQLPYRRHGLVGVGEPEFPTLQMSHRVAHERPCRHAVLASVAGQLVPGLALAHALDVPASGGGGELDDEVDTSTDHAPGCPVCPFKGHVIAEDAGARQTHLVPRHG